MARPIWLDHALQGAVDAAVALIPRPRPSDEKLRSAKIIAHRGEIRGDPKIENTLKAFENAINAGCWGIEFDVRWTKDLVPVIHHDSDLSRLRGSKHSVENSLFKDLRKIAPDIPTLEETIDLARSRIHLMIEIKSRTDGFTPAHIESFQQNLKQLEPGRDFHLIALAKDVLESFPDIPSYARLPVSDVNFSAMSRLALEKNYGGITGHYLLLNEDVRKRHEAAGQKIGTGFVRSKNCLFRELNRGVEWIFTNDASELMQMIRSNLTSR